MFSCDGDGDYSGRFMDKKSSFILKTRVQFTFYCCVRVVPQQQGKNVAKGKSRAQEEVTRYHLSK